MRRDAAKAEDYARRHGVPRFYSDASQLIADPDVDAVYIATPPSTHESYALAVAKAGKPCYVEKPMARNASECNRMIEAFDAASLPLYVAYYRRRQPRFLRAAELLATGAIGAVTGASWRYGAPKHAAEGGWRVDPEASGGGLFVDLGSHALDVLDFLLGPLAFVGGAAACVASKHAVEDTVAMTLTTAAGVPVSVAANFAAAVKIDELRISGTAGEITLAVFEHDRLTLTRAAARGSGPATVEEWTLPNGPHVAAGLVQSCVDALLGRGECPSSGASAARTSHLIDQALEAFYGGREDGFWERRRWQPGGSAVAGSEGS
jgi:1,5-anhydro-D-fructose reductase (1,5-anhydro-D-mannitol-forming)